MAGIDFDRQVFVPTNPPQTRSTAQLLGPVLLVLALLAIAFVGYKIFVANSQNNEVAAANAQVQQLEQQLNDMQKRLDTLEKHRKAVPVEKPFAPVSVVASTPTHPTRTV